MKISRKEVQLSNIKISSKANKIFIIKEKEIKRTEMKIALQLNGL